MKLRGLFTVILAGLTASLLFAQVGGPPVLTYEYQPAKYELAQPLSFEKVKQDAIELPAPGTMWSITGYYDIVNKRTSSGAATFLRRFPNVIWRGFDVDVDAYLGFGTKDSAPVTGLFFGKRGHFADRVKWYLALGLTLANKRPTGAGVSGGLTVEF